MAAQAQVFEGTITGQFVPFGPRRIGGGIPEVYIAKEIDNSRVVKVSDPQREREMRAFVTMAVVCFLLLMTYAWQHFGSIEYGYRIEAQKSERDRVAEANRSLRLEAASLRDPERIDMLARRLGLTTPQVGQVQRIDAAAGDAAVGYVARASNLGVVTVVQ